MTEAEKVSRSLFVCQRVKACAEWGSAKNVLLYAAMADEVGLHTLIDEAFHTGKTVWLPVVDGDNLRIRKYEEGKTAVSAGFGIEEPTAETEELTEREFNRIELAVVPGRAFTRDGLRLGRGKGYYDRFLAKYKGLTIGVGFSCQLLEQLPVDDWDKPLDMIITD